MAVQPGALHFNLMSQEWRGPQCRRTAMNMLSESAAGSLWLEREGVGRPGRLLRR
ncbi:hypothetical protein P691DRAFT_807696 [Macrolepiota fuliginosa MF-IS2]|uniref:Uncharacterized protein n=1 Tax=Macrolepiota fuliginosa MF-IS2 TaxID=1400762 RepID=A0A9P6C043_9AGAR|nr:hypothetical protein P691DRAFT_807696 [Macrolepiota fuliginosa MF-IS2]